MFISLLTLIVFIYQTNLIRQQQFMSVYPHLMMGNFGSNSVAYQYVLSNEGIGPAIITNISIKDKDHIYSDLTTYVNSQLTESDSVWYYNTDLNVGQLIPAGTQITLFGLQNVEQTNKLNLPANTIKAAIKMREVLNKEDLLISIEYKSIYEEKWSINNLETSPQKLE